MYSRSQVEDLLGKPVKKKETKNTITFWYGGWSLNELREMKPELFCDQSWYTDQKFAEQKNPAGMYEVTFCVPDSQNKTFKEQKALLKDAEPCPVAVLATAVLLSLIETGKDHFSNYWSRCIEQTDGGRAALNVYGGRMVVLSFWDGHRGDSVFLGAARKFRTLKS